MFLLAETWGPAIAQSTDQYFPETGHYVKGEFLQYYRNAKDPQTLYGYPITEEFVSRDGRTVQYFQRARLEWRPELPEGQRIQITSVGRELYKPGRPLPVTSPSACRRFPETEQQVCYAFLEFFDNNGGVAQFGYPVSPFEDHDGLIVQYFEKARFEWKPWLPEGQRVGLAHFGRLYFDYLREDPNALRPVPKLDASIVVTRLQLHAFTSKAVTIATDQQLIYIIVQDQNLQPVGNVQGMATVRWPTGATESFPFTSNNKGVGVLPLSFTNQPYGTLVYIDVAVTKDGVTGKTTTSFRIWY